METAKQLVNRYPYGQDNLAKQNDETSKEGLITQKHIDALWDRMIELYDYAWTSRYGDTPTKVWTSVLTSLTPQDIKTGLDALLARRDDYACYPPRPLEFFNLCRPVISKNPDRTHHAAYEDYKHPLLIRLPDKEIALRHLEQLRNIIGNRTKTTQG